MGLPAIPPSGLANRIQAGLSTPGSGYGDTVARADASDAFSLTLAALEAGQSAAWIIPTDSTGNEATEWIYLSAQAICALLPSIRCEYKLWSDASQGFGATTVIQAGDDGPRGITFSGASSVRHRVIPQASVGYPTGDIDVRYCADAPDWTPAAEGTFGALYGSAGDRSWRFFLRTDGRIVFEWSPDGTTLIAFGSAVTAPSFTDGETYWVRATLDVDNGGGGYTVTLYTSTDGVTWTTHGQDVTASGTTSLHQANGTNGYNLGGRTGNTSIFTGNIYACEIRDGIDGKILNPQPIESWNRVNTSADISPLCGSPTLYVINGAHPGAALSYLTDSTRLPKLVPPYENATVFMSCGHNDTTDAGVVLTAKWDAWLTALKARLPVAAFVPIIQNTDVSPSATVEETAKRANHIAFWALKNGLRPIDVRRKFNQLGAASLTEPGDGVHPTKTGSPSGSSVWSGVVAGAYSRRSL